MEREEKAQPIKFNKILICLGARDWLQDIYHMNKQSTMTVLVALVQCRKQQMYSISPLLLHNDQDGIYERVEMMGNWYFTIR